MAGNSMILAGAAVLIGMGTLRAFPHGPDPALTGGFQEGTCVQCHDSFPLNGGRILGGNFHLAGVPARYTPGATYTLSAVLWHPGQARWGFQVSARFSGSGSQAGELVPLDGTTQLKEEGGVAYIEHTQEGTRMGQVDGPVEFRFQWIAPSDPNGVVLFNGAGNAANGNNQPTGDYIYTAGAFSRGPGAAVLPVASHPTEREKRLRSSSKVLHLPAPVDLNKGDLEFHVQHRFLGTFSGTSGPRAKAGNAFGTDEGANINLELNYALSDRLSVGASRARFAFNGTTFLPAVVGFTGTYELYHPPASDLRLSLLGGVEGQENFGRHFSPFLQLAASFDQGRARWSVVPTLIFNSRRDDLLRFLGPLAVNPEDNYTLALGLALDYALHPRFSLVGEYTPRLSGFGGFGSRHSTVAAGIKVNTWKHVFSVLISSSRDFTPAGYAVNSTTNDFSLGFNIYRRMGR